MPFIEAQTGNLARIKVVGVGGGGQNSVSSMINSNSIDGVEFIAMNTDLQALNSSSAEIRVQLGPEKTHGLGSGADPDIGLEAAQESLHDIEAHLQGSDMVFVASGMGGGTGSGAAPVVAEVAKKSGALTVGVVTKPFHFEGKRRMNQAEQGIRALKDKVDALIVIPNEKILEVVDDEVPLSSAFKIADSVIGQAVEGISELITSTGLVNVDFADVKTVMENAGSALMGIGEANGEDRAQKAAELAVKSPLLDDDIEGSTGILVNISGDASLTMHEVNTASSIIADAAHEGANIIWGANIDPQIDGIRVTVIATGFDSDFRSARLASSDSMSDEDVIEQIDSRFDTTQSTSDTETSNEEESEEEQEKYVINNQEEDFESQNFNIDDMRAQIEEMEKSTAIESAVQEEVETESEPKETESESEKESSDDNKKSVGFWNKYLNKS